jgi:hypothetical protein
LVAGQQAAPGDSEAAAGIGHFGRIGALGRSSSFQFRSPFGKREFVDREFLDFAVEDDLKAVREKALEHLAALIRRYGFAIGSRAHEKTRPAPGWL